MTVIILFIIVKDPERVGFPVPLLHGLHSFKQAGIFSFCVKQKGFMSKKRIRVL